MDLTFFVKDGQIYQRFDETHVQYAHQTEQVQSQLTQAGFAVQIFDCYSQDLPNDTTQRVTFVATKQ